MLTDWNMIKLVINYLAVFDMMFQTKDTEIDTEGCLSQANMKIGPLLAVSWDFK